MRLFLLSILISVFTILNATALIGNAERVNGNVKVQNEGSIKKNKLDSGYEIKVGDLIITSKSSSAVIKLSDGSNIVLDESSSVHFKNTNEAQQQDGKIYYKITSRDSKNSLKITTPFAIIGIKGTTFIVNAKDKEASVSLKEGLIGVQSIKEEFALYRKKLEAEYNKFVDDQMKEYEAFLKEGEEGVAEMTKEFDMHAGTSISFSGQKAKESGWTEDDEKELDYFESLIQGKTGTLSRVTNNESSASETKSDESKDLDKAEKNTPKTEKKQEIAKETAKPATDEKPSDEFWSEEDDAELDMIEAQFKK